MDESRSVLRNGVLFLLVLGGLTGCTHRVIHVAVPAVVNGGTINPNGTYKSISVQPNETQQALYVETDDDLDRKTLKAIISISAPIQFQNSGHLSAKKISKLLYGTSSSSYVKALKDLNRPASVSDLAVVKAFAAPSFFESSLVPSAAPPIPIGESAFSYPPMSYSYVALQTNDKQEIEKVVSTIRDAGKKATRARELRLVPNWHLSGEDCRPDSNEPADPYYSLKGWTFPINARVMMSLSQLWTVELA